MDKHEVDYCVFKKKGNPTRKQVDTNNKSKILQEIKKSEKYKKVLEIFPDAELIDAKLEDDNWWRILVKY